MLSLYVAIGGGMGAVARYWLVSAVGRFASSSFPYGTLEVNILGSLLIGVVVGWLTKTLPHSMETRAFLVVGVLGGFTTFSTFSLDTLSLIENGALVQAAIYILSSLIGGVLALYLALLISRMV